MAANTSTLRSMVSELTQNLPANIRAELEKRTKLLKDKDEKQLKEEMDKTTESVKKAVEYKVDDINKTVKGLTPSKPEEKNFSLRSDFDNAMKEYGREMEAFRTLVALATTVLDDFRSLVNDILETLRNFLKEIWNAVKKVVVDIASKVESFVAGVKNKVTAWFSKAFS